MDIHVFLAVLAAAALHATWNAIVKGGGDPFLSMAHMTIWAVGLSTCLLAFVPFPRPEAWIWLALSAFLHGLYRAALIRMYRHGDLGLLYPIARGAAPLMTAVITLLLIDEHLSSAGYLGIVLLAAGVTVLSLRGSRVGGIDPIAVGLALLTAVFISSYSFVDGHGARVNGSGPGFAIWMFFVNSVSMVPIMLAIRGREVLATFPLRWKPALGATAMSELAYFIAIWAMTHAPIALVAALRETSVLFAAAISVFVLGEPLTRWRIAAAAIIVTGAMLMRVA